MQTGDFSKVYSFLTAGPVGSTTNAKMILIADLGHTELDYSDEYDYDVSWPPCMCSTCPCFCGPQTRSRCAHNIQAALEQIAVRHCQELDIYLLRGFASFLNSAALDLTHLRFPCAAERRHPQLDPGWDSKHGGPDGEAARC